MNMPTRVVTEPLPRTAIRRSWIYTGMGAVAALAVAVGFGRTYVIPMSQGSFKAPAIVHIHGGLATAWILLFLVQPLLVRWRRLRLHRQVGRLGLPLAAGIGVTMIPAGYFQVARDVAAGGGATAISSIVGIFTAAALFFGLVTAGIVARRDREAHARWLLLATLVVVWPAWFRFRHYFPWVPRPDIWFALVLAYVWIAVAAMHDWHTRSSVHPVLLWGGLFVVVEQSLETVLFDSAGWRSVAAVLYRWLQSSWLA